MSSKVVKNKEKMGKVELLFNIFSIIILLGCIGFYGYRMIYYKNKFSIKTADGKKAIMLYDSLKKTTTTKGDGLYNDNNTFVFKGNNVNNYIKFSGLTYRIIKINKDNTIEAALIDEVNYLSYGNNIEYNKSNLRKYLNEEFLNNLDKSYLVKSPYCLDKITDNNGSMKCNNISVDYIKLISLKDYLNSKIDGKSYLDSDKVVWLNDNNGEKVWSKNNGSLSLSNPEELYGVQIVITFNNLNTLISGNGTKENPYKIEDKNNYYASYVKLDNDMYRVYEENDKTLKLVSNTLYNNGNTKYSFSKDNNILSLDKGIGKYINNDILNKLSYKEELTECDFDIGSYNKMYENVKNETINSKISVPSILVPIFNKEITNYYLSTPKDKEIYIYNDGIYSTKPNIVRNIMLCSCIDKTKINSGNGELESPYQIVKEK